MAEQPSTPVGFITLAFSWLNVLDEIASDLVTGLDVVIKSSSGSSFTYTIKDGKAQPRGPGDRHDDAYSAYKQKRSLVQHA